VSNLWGSPAGGDAKKKKLVSQSKSPKESEGGANEGPTHLHLGLKGDEEVTIIRHLEDPAELAV